MFYFPFFFCYFVKVSYIYILNLINESNLLSATLTVLIYDTTDILHNITLVDYVSLKVVDEL